ATMRASIQRIVERFSPERIVVAGDLKHEFSRNLEQEWSEVRSLLSFLRENAEVLLVRGNHDNYLRTIASRLGIEMRETCSAGAVTFAHGHLDNPSRPLVIGHEHPSIKIIDRVGASIKLPCFVRLMEERVLVMPAFSPLAVGVDMARIEPSECLSPILRGSDLREAEIFACSEVGLLRLGRIGDIGSLTV
ncbi:MAG: metallophosphoesterase, partial [Euryarchaeota archaeon]|nr:metallophosphoesterase [Euryarchaeota archaeon]